LTEGREVAISYTISKDVALYPPVISNGVSQLAGPVDLPLILPLI
jgi:hypothetical protein